MQFPGAGLTAASLIEFVGEGPKRVLELGAGGGQVAAALADLGHDTNSWTDLASLEADYLPEIWRNPSEAALKAGHGGGDYFEILDFINSITDAITCPIGIHEAMDMTLPGLISQESIVQGGAWLDVPDSRDWTIC